MTERKRRDSNDCMGSEERSSHLYIPPWYHDVGTSNFVCTCLFWLYFYKIADSPFYVSWRLGFVEVCASLSWVLGMMDETFEGWYCGLHWKPNGREEVDVRRTLPDTDVIEFSRWLLVFRSPHPSRDCRIVHYMLGMGDVKLSFCTSLWRLISNGQGVSYSLA